MKIWHILVPPQYLISMAKSPARRCFSCHPASPQTAPSQLASLRERKIPKGWCVEGAFCLKFQSHFYSHLRHTRLSCRIPPDVCGPGSWVLEPSSLSVLPYPSPAPHLEQVYPVPRAGSAMGQVSHSCQPPVWPSTLTACPAPLHRVQPPQPQAPHPTFGGKRGVVPPPYRRRCQQGPLPPLSFPIRSRGSTEGCRVEGTRAWYGEVPTRLLASFSSTAFPPSSMRYYGLRCVRRRTAALEGRGVGVWWKSERGTAVRLAVR